MLRSTRPRSTRRASLTLFGLALALLLVLPGGSFAGELTTLGLPQLDFDIRAPEKVTFSGGQTATGAYYQFAVPDGWTPADGLVIWNHGFSLSPIAPEPSLGPLVEVQLAQGYAVAASSYSLTGWAVFQAVDDLEQMVAEFRAEYGVPAFVYVYGASLGGIVTVQAIEQANLGNVVGAMPICGVLSGSRTWDAGVDFRLAYDAICGEVPGASIPGGAAGLAFPPDPNFDEMAMVVAVNTCTGVAQPAATRTPEQQARLDEFLAVTQIPENFVLTDMGLATFGLADLTYDPRKLAGGQAMDNSAVDYGDETINEEIERVTADTAARNLLVDNYTPHGLVGDVKIVSLHTDKDGLILVENENDYAAKVPAGNFTLGVIVEDVPSHCVFSPAETLAGWEALRGWTAGAPQPTAQVLQGTCEAIEAGAIAPGPCRIDPAYEVADLDQRIRPRATCVEDDDTLCLAGQFALETNWTDFEGNTGAGMRVPLTADTGAFWFFGPNNLELMLKILDGRQINGHFWFFYGALSNVQYEITVTDTVTLKQNTYVNPLGNFASDVDIEAF